MSWDAWGRREFQRNASDKRVQAIRCTSCHRLRQHPKQDDPRTCNCPCGGFSFVNSFPHPDEEQLAIKLYSRELEENGTFTNIAKEVLDDWRAKHPVAGDTPERVKLYSS